jgi:divalent metal cation (Fe/Co/Zn/Cd) transporter
VDDAVRRSIALRGRRIEYFTIVWNTIEGIIAVSAGAVAGSISLMGFGIDSFIEVISAGTLLWRMAVDADIESRERNERLSLRIVGGCFVVLAAYISFESISDLAKKSAPEHSIPGSVLACVSLIVMPLLSRSKRRIGAQLGSRAMKADAKQTDFCIYLSSILLVGLVANSTLGWWWADQVSGLVMVPIIAKEGWQSLRGDACECN